MKEWLKLQIGQLFSTNLWTPVTIIFTNVWFFKFILFDIIWCLQTTFINPAKRNVML